MTKIIANHLMRQADIGPWPCELDTSLSAVLAAEAVTEISDWPSYAPTPLRSLEHLAQDLEVAAIHYKDESERFGLGSFKALGGAYAVLQVAADQLDRVNGTRPTLKKIREGAHAESLARMTVVTATDGNHGRSVAWGARMAGCRCRIYMHAGVSVGRQRAVEELGADVIRTMGDYDESLRVCSRDAEENGWFIVSDTSYAGYMDVPRYVMAGYGVMVLETIQQLDGAIPTHVFVQAGVGGLAAAACAVYWQLLGERRPRFIVVEPDLAPCNFESARLGRATTIQIERETAMAGLSCGEVSLLAWDVLARGAAHFVTIGEDQVAPAMRLLAAGKAGGGRIIAGESAVPGLIALMGAAGDSELRREMKIDADSRIMLFGSEGATDPDIYRAMIGTTNAREVA